MANHAYAKTGKKLDPKEVDVHIRKIVKEKLHDVFNVEFKDSSKEKMWIIRYKDDGYIALKMWISDEVEYGEMKGDKYVEYEKPKIINEGSMLEFRHGHNFQFMWWVEGVVRENLGEIYHARMFDEGCEIDPEPKPTRYETFESYCRNGKSDKETIEKKNFILPSWQKKDIPKELIEVLNLDFKL